ncbi:hypothetical protein PIB30_002191 [Stylosanthes scabra]|uniref:Uncharacterized protein n=1 Tax=Stylosanthes scabra TaxID=79078 RepID=A0ABU6S2V0_9FABA|nr:hypothetical protein [Stylosanthes scabra]
MVKIATKIAFVMVLLALVATNGFGLRQTPTNVVIQNDECDPGGCGSLGPVCAPRFAVCDHGVCKCSDKPPNNNVMDDAQKLN